MFHIADIFNVDIVESPVNVDNDGDGDSCLSGCDRNDKQGEKVALQVFREKILIEHHEIDIHRVQHQLDRHQDRDKVPSDKEAVYPDKEHDCCDNQEMNDGNALYHDVLNYPVNLFSFLQ
jgi:hypothetical protein